MLSKKGGMAQSVEKSSYKLKSIGTKGVFRKKRDIPKDVSFI